MSQQLNPSMAVTQGDDAKGRSGKITGGPDVPGKAVAHQDIQGDPDGPACGGPQGEADIVIARGPGGEIGPGADRGEQPSDEKDARRAGP